MISFHVPAPRTKTVTALAEKGRILQQAIQNILQAGQAIDPSFVINAWNTEHKIRTLTKATDIDHLYLMTQRYCYIPDRAVIKTNNTCWYWGFYVSCDTNMTRFLHYWEEQKPRARKERATTPYQAISPAPLQSQEWHEAGWITGTTRHQYTDEICKALQKETENEGLGLHWRSITYPGVGEHWAQAKRTFAKNHNVDEKYRLSPMAMAIMVPRKAEVGPTMKYMYDTYGKTEHNGAWPRFPDGSRLRYTPNFYNVKGIKGKKMVNTRMALQIQMHFSNQNFETNIVDPGKRMQCLENKSIGSVILDMQCEMDEHTEPYFRHFALQWNRNPDIKKWYICSHQHMFQAAQNKLNTLISDLVNAHGDEIYTAFKTDEATMRSYANITTGHGESDFNFDLNDDGDDIYLNGKSKFKFYRIPDVVNEDNRGRTLREIQTDADDSLGFTATEQNNDDTNTTNINQPPTQWRTQNHTTEPANSNPQQQPTSSTSSGGGR